MEWHFDGLELRYIPRKKNIEADELSRLASSRAPLPPWVFEEKLRRPTVTGAEHDEGGSPPLSWGTQALPPAEANHLVSACPQVQSWMDDIRDYLKEKFLPDDDAIAERIARQSKRYAMVDGNLYWRDTDGVFLWCISREEGGELLANIH